MLTQQCIPRDSNSEGVLIPAGALRKALTPHADDAEVKKPTRRVSPHETPNGKLIGKLGLGLDS